MTVLAMCVEGKNPTVYQFNSLSDAFDNVHPNNMRFIELSTGNIYIYDDEGILLVQDTIINEE